MTERVQLGDTVVLEHKNRPPGRSEIVVVGPDDHDPAHGREGRRWADILRLHKQGDEVILPLPEENILEARIIEIRRAASNAAA